MRSAHGQGSGDWLRRMVDGSRAAETHEADERNDAEDHDGDRPALGLVDLGGKLGVGAAHGDERREEQAGVSLRIQRSQISNGKVICD